jgi:Domain of unknown function (DUF5666)
MTASLRSLLPVSLAALLITAACGGSTQKSPTSPDPPSIKPAASAAAALPDPVASPPPASSSQVELQGAATDFSGACPDRGFRIGSHAVVTNASTDFTGGACADLKDTPKVEVRGLPQADGSVLADTVKFDDGPGANQPGGDESGDHAEGNDVEEESASGPVSGLGGSCPDATFTVDGHSIVTTSTTSFLGGTCGDLKEGVVVEVEGAASGSTITAAKVKFEDEGDDDSDEQEVELSGTVSGLAGTCPATTFTLAGHTVVTGSATEFSTPCASVANEMTVEVKGTQVGSGPVQASRVKVED